MGDVSRVSRVSRVWKKGTGQNKVGVTRWHQNQALWDLLHLLSPLTYTDKAHTHTHASAFHTHTHTHTGEKLGNCTKVSVLTGLTDWLREMSQAVKSHSGFHHRMSTLCQIFYQFYYFFLQRFNKYESVQPVWILTDFQQYSPLYFHVCVSVCESYTDI